MFIIEIPLGQTAVLTGKSSATVTDWFDVFRDICSQIIEEKPQMIGTDTNPI